MKSFSWRFHIFETLLFWHMQFIHLLFQMNLVCGIANLYFKQVYACLTSLNLKYYVYASLWSINNATVQIIMCFSCPQPETLEFRYELAFLRYLKPGFDYLIISKRLWRHTLGPFYTVRKIGSIWAYPYFIKTNMGACMLVRWYTRHNEFLSKNKLRLGLFALISHAVYTVP